MSQNILFWLDSAGTYFGIAYFLQNYDYDLYAICDVTEKQKKFFKTQNIVNFKKTLFFHDQIKKHIVLDYDYLKSFEQRYGIDLWKLAINERFFYIYNEFYKFTTDEITSILVQECKFFEDLLSTIKPDFLICMDPSTHHHRILYEMCRKKGIIPLILNRARMGYKMMISMDAQKLDESIQDNVLEKNNPMIDLEEYLADSPKQLEEVHKKQFSSKFFMLKALLQFLITKNDNINTHYTYYGRSKFRVLIKKIIIEIKQKYRQQFINRHLVSNIDLTKPFIYFPLHMDMEQNPLITAPFFTNQIEVIRSIAKSIVPGYVIYVKEHPSQVLRGWRKKSFYEEILKIPNVFLIHPNYPSNDLVKNCKLIITISGTAGLEGAFYNKPSIVFTDLKYSTLPSVHQIKNMNELPNAIRTSLQKQLNTYDLRKYLDYVDKNSFEFNYTDINIKEANQFYYGGFLMDNEISLISMKSFLKENEKVLNTLALEHLKKIQYRKQ